MKISTKLILPIFVLVIIAAVLAVTSVTLVLQREVKDQGRAFSDYTLQNLSDQAKNRQKMIYSSIDQVGKTALAQAAVFTEVPEIQNVYELALSGNINDENDASMQQARVQLRKIMAPFIKGLTDQTDLKDFQIHFHVPSSRSLSRLWRTDWQAMRDGKKVDISDDLSSFRQTVVQINQGDHHPISGIEVGRGGFAIRGLAPVIGKDGKHAGSVEVLGSFDEVLTSNHTSDNYQIAVYMLADLLPIATRLQDPAKNPVLDDKYVFVSSTAAEITDAEVTAAQLDAGSRGYHEEMTANQFIATFPIPDFSGQVAGVMALSYDLDKIKAIIQGINDEGEKTITTVKWQFTVGAIMLLIIICGLIFLATRRIVVPLRMAVAVAQKVADGDLREKVNYQGRDEVGELAGAVNYMVESLNVKAQEASQIAEGNLDLEVAAVSEHDSMGMAFREMVANLNGFFSEVSIAADQINAGSVQVSDSAQSLSQGATESAASLQEITSTMNLISAQTQQSAHNASEASNLAETAKGVATVGSERMGAMVSAMKEINEAGQSISRIIKVIDEIAFQTNLLALNAAVEAARAGQHGKGFAVVAEEVRNLAARSAKAAEETAELIQGSVEKGENGTLIAEKTSESLNEIVAAVNTAATLVADIARSSQEQAQGISQVNEGLGQIDSGVQQSTATSEESAAVAEELSSQAAQLRHLLGRFRLASQSSATRRMLS